jgi:NAD(P)-dependent dehydrogenase (short-subunit alcohol dehydrogenase family)
MSLVACACTDIPGAVAPHDGRGGGQRGREVPDSWGLTGKVAVVTGGGAAGDGIGNGRAAAILLARAGAQVVVVDRDEALAQRTVTMIAEGGGTAIAVQADVTHAADCAAIVQTALERFGRLDLLDNNVGIGSRGTVLDETEEHWRRVMQVNVDSMFLMARQVIPAMRRQGGGAIVNVSSISALPPARAHRLYRLQRRGDRADAGAGGRSRARAHPRQLRGAGPRLHADGLCGRHERRGA